MRDVDEVRQRATEHLFTDAEPQSGDGGSHSVLQVVRPLEGKLIQREGEVVPLEVDAHRTLVALVRRRAYLRVGQEGQALHRHRLVRHHIAGDELVLAPVDEGIVAGLILQDAHLGQGVLLEVVVVAVEVVGRDVHQEGDVHAELVHIVQLEAAELDDEVVGLLVGHDLTGEAEAHVTRQPHGEPCLGEDVVQPHRGGRLAIAPRDTDDLRPRAQVATRQLDLRDHRDACSAYGLHDRRLLGDPGALDDLVSA